MPPSASSALDTTERVAHGISSLGYAYLLSGCLLAICAMAVWIARQGLRFEREAKQREKEADEAHQRREYAAAQEAQRREAQARDEGRALTHLALRMATGVDDTRVVLLKLQERMEALERRMAEEERLIRERIKPQRPL